MATGWSRDPRRASVFSMRKAIPQRLGRWIQQVMMVLPSAGCSVGWRQEAIHEIFRGFCRNTWGFPIFISHEKIFPLVLRVVGYSWLSTIFGRPVILHVQNQRWGYTLDAIKDAQQVGVVGTSDGNMCEQIHIYQLRASYIPATYQL